MPEVTAQWWKVSRDDGGFWQAQRQDDAGMVLAGARLAEYGAALEWCRADAAAVKKYHEILASRPLMMQKALSGLQR